MSLPATGSESSTPPTRDSESLSLPLALDPAPSGGGLEAAFPHPRVPHVWRRRVDRRSARPALRTGMPRGPGRWLLDRRRVLLVRDASRTCRLHAGRDAASSEDRHVHEPAAVGINRRPT